MDTDSAYIALAGKNLEDLVKPELKKQFFEEWNNWLPAEACATHQEEFVQGKMSAGVWEPKECCIKQKKLTEERWDYLKWNGEVMV